MPFELEILLPPTVHLWELQQNEGKGSWNCVGRDEQKWAEMGGGHKEKK